MKTTDANADDAAYRPVSCAAYSEFERAILHRRRLRLVWHEANVIYDRVLRPLDLKTRNHEEFLICQAQPDEPRAVRLDRIRSAEPT